MKLLFKPFKNDPKRARAIIADGCKDKFAYVEWCDPIPGLCPNGEWVLRELTWLTCANEENHGPGMRSSVTPAELIYLGEFLQKQKPPKKRKA